MSDTCGVLEALPSLGRRSRLCPFSYPAKEHSTRTEIGGKERLMEGKTREVEERQSRGVERPAHRNYRGGMQKTLVCFLSWVS